MDIKVREVTDVEEKSSQQIEQELLEKHEQKQEVQEQPVEAEEIKEEVQQEAPEEEKVQEEVKEELEAPPVEEQPPVPQELAEDEVLSYIGKRYGKEINSIDELK